MNWSGVIIKSMTIPLYCHSYSRRLIAIDGFLCLVNTISLLSMLQNAFCVQLLY